jgi:hypothetical protein
MSRRQKDTRVFSALTDQEITDPAEVVRVTVWQHPELPGYPVAFTAALSELGGIGQAQVVTVWLTFANREQAKITVDKEAFDLLATRPMSAVLGSAHRAVRRL